LTALPTSHDLRVDTGALSYNMEFRQDFIYKHNVAYLKCKNNVAYLKCKNSHDDGPFTFFIPMNHALGPSGAEEFILSNYTIIGHQDFEGLLKNLRVTTIGTTTLHFSKDNLNSKVTISGGEGVANIVLSFHLKSNNAVVHLILRVLEEDEPDITDEVTLSSIGNTIATDTTRYTASPIFATHSIFELPCSSSHTNSNLGLLPSSQDFLTSSRPAAMSSMSICSNKKDMNNLLTVAAAKTEDNCNNMPYISMKEANNVATAGSTDLEESNEAMPLTSLQDTKKDNISVLSQSIKQI
jgi:hypothetical protein